MKQYWTREEIDYILSLDKKDMDVYEIAEKFNRTPSSVCNMIRKMTGYDLRNSLIGTKRRAINHYNLIINRLKKTNLLKNKCYKGIKLNISKEEFVEWFMKNDFKNCSVDRIDKNKDYSLDNIQLIPLVDNIRKDKIKEHDGMCECYVCNQTKPLSEFAKDNRRLNAYTTICKECERKRGREKYKRLYKKSK